MKTLSYRIGKRVYTRHAPSSIKEMTQEQILGYYKFLGSNEKDYLVNLFSLIPLMWKIELMDYDGFSDEQQYQILVSCILDSHDELGKAWMIKDWEGLAGPPDGFESMSWGEWIFVDALHEQYIQTRNPAALQKLIACLYRKPAAVDVQEETGDRRVAFNAAHIERGREALPHIPSHFVLIFLINYKSILEFLKKRYKAVFPAASGSFQVAKPEKTSWLRLGMSLVDNDPIRAVELEKMNLHLVLLSINSKIEENLKASRK